MRRPSASIPNDFANAAATANRSILKDSRWIRVSSLIPGRRPSIDAPRRCARTNGVEPDREPAFPGSFHAGKIEGIATGLVGRDAIAPRTGPRPRNEGRVVDHLERGTEHEEKTYAGRAAPPFRRPKASRRCRPDGSVPGRFPVRRHPRHHGPSRGIDRIVVNSGFHGGTRRRRARSGESRNPSCAEGSDAGRVP